MDGLQVGPIRIKRYLVRLYLSALGIFALNKLFVRRWVLRSDAPAFVDTIVLSLPNAVEAMVGMTGIAVLLFLARERFRARMQATPDGIIYIVTALATTAFVVSQELNLHRLGGTQVYDPLDVAASMVGVLLMLFLFVRRGVCDPAQPARRPQ